MPSMTNYLENALLRHICNIESFAMPTSLRVALCTADPGESGTIANEVTGGGYARQPVTLVDNGLSAGTFWNSNEVAFGPATANWGLVTFAAILDQSGNVLFRGRIDASQNIETGQVYRFDPNTILCTLD